MTACVENLIHISVLSDGKYTIKYNSIGDKLDLDNKDFIHPKNTEFVKWATTMTFLDEKDVFSKNLNWEKETISTEPINKKMIFSDSQSLIYSIDVDKKGYFFWDRYSFKSTVHSLDIDTKYPSIIEYLDTEADSLSWIVPAKKYIIKKSLKEYDKQAELNIIFIERVNNQVDSYFSYAEERELIDKFDKNSSIILKDALKPISTTLPKNFFQDMKIFVDKYEADFLKNIELMNDYFQFNINLPGIVRSNNAQSNSDGLLVWSFDFDIIAKDQFKMYANSIRINKLRIQLLLVMIIVGFLGILWNQKLKKK
ncbi:hypothetical protein OAP62_00215 [Candidatus Marinimicrobia bacterium]|nr:hypothetical protein [Candidatus Neomarinimicrobiota bacterium]|tara:strand:- start:12033 stop:12965 length:933 start_codon:yes stop_codon:yes gene_type:complete